MDKPLCNVELHYIYGDVLCGPYTLLYCSTVEVWFLLGCAESYSYARPQWQELKTCRNWKLMQATNYSTSAKEHYWPVMHLTYGRMKKSTWKERAKEHHQPLTMRQLLSTVCRFYNHLGLWIYTSQLGWNLLVGSTVLLCVYSWPIIRCCNSWLPASITL